MSTYAPGRLPGHDPRCAEASTFANALVKTALESTERTVGVGRISLDLWGTLEAIYFDRDAGLFGAEPDEGTRYWHPNKSRRHLRYRGSAHRAKGVTLTILSVACLEAYINEIIHLDPRIPKKIRDELRHLRIRDKYPAFIGQFAPEKPSRNDEPFRSFELLVRLRNALVHYGGGAQQQTSEVSVLLISDLVPENGNSRGDPIHYIQSIEDEQFPAWVRGVVSELLRVTNAAIVDKVLCLDPELSWDANATIWDQTPW